MSLQVEVLTPDAEKIIKNLEKMSPDIKESQASALSSAGFFATQKARRWMASSGKGTWPKPHPLSKETLKIKRQGGEFTKRPRGQLFLIQSAQFARYILTAEGMVTGFAFDSRPSSFNRQLENTIAKLEKGYRILVTPKMRKFLAANGYPLRSSTKYLEVPERPIDKYVTKAVSAEIYEVFESKFLSSLGRKNDFADKEFRRGAGIEKSFGEL